jgi:hypothetical protein
VEDVTLPIDKIVVNLIKESYLKQQQEFAI